MRILISILLLLPLTVFASTCKLCGYEKKHKVYPAYSAQLQEVITKAEENLKIQLKEEDKKIINKIILRENREGILTEFSKSGKHYGLGQGDRGAYKTAKVPWLTKCPVEQVKMIIGYVKSRYKTFENAWKHHKRKRWY